MARPRLLLLVVKWKEEEEEASSYFLFSRLETWSFFYEPFVPDCPSSCVLVFVWIHVHASVYALVEFHWFSTPRWNPDPGTILGRSSSLLGIWASPEKYMKVGLPRFWVFLVRWIQVYASVYGAFTQYFTHFLRERGPRLLKWIVPALFALESGVFASICLCVSQAS